MNVQTIGLVLLLTLSNVGCGSLIEKVNPIEVFSKPIERVPLNLNPPVLQGLPAPEFYVITPNNAEEVWKKMNDNGESPVLFGVNDASYRNLATMMSTVRSQIWMQNEIIKKYKEYYEPEKQNK